MFVEKINGYPLTFAAKNVDELVRSGSRSGGVFTELARPFLDGGGAVYGCALTRDFMAEHIRVDSWGELPKLRGSKYIQSSMIDAWSLLEKDLGAGVPILFSGTPCQVAAVRSFAAAKRLSLEGCLLVDVVCHGVPSPSVWEAYLRHMEIKYGGKVEAVDFRDKGRFGWQAHHESVLLNGEVRSTETFKNLFLAHHALRLACAKCPYKSTRRAGDVSIADFWGIDEVVPGFNDDRGVSLVLVSSLSGRRAFETARKNLHVVEVPLERSLQPALMEQFPEPANRASFWHDFHSGVDVESLEKRYALAPWWLRAIRKVRRGLKKVISL